MVEGKGLINRCTLLRSNMNKEKGRMDTYLETRSTTSS